MELKQTFKKGQSFLEYAFVIGISAIVLITMHNYLSRSYQGKLKGSADQMGGEYLPQAGVRKNTWSFSYEDKRGYTVEIGGSSRSEVASLRGQVIMSDIAELEDNSEQPESQLGGFAASLDESDFYDPQGTALKEKLGLNNDDE